MKNSGITNVFKEPQVFGVEKHNRIVKDIDGIIAELKPFAVDNTAASNAIQELFEASEKVNRLYRETNKIPFANKEESQSGETEKMKS